MIVVDTSAILAILQGEAGCEALAKTIEEDERPTISAGSAIECGIVSARKAGEAGLRMLHEFFAAADIRIHETDADQVDTAIEAARRYGKGSGHPARLNFGDCFSYAAAKTLDAPLLFVGNDFVHTDLRAAIEPSLSQRRTAPSRRPRAGSVQ